MGIATERWSPKRFSKGSGAWTATRQWDVIAATSEADAISSVGVSENDEHPLSSLVYCETLDAAPNGYNAYLVTANYSSTPAGRFPNPGDPLDEPYEYTWQFGSASESVDRDNYENPISNTNGDVLSSLPSKEFPVIYLTVRRNEPYFDISTAIQYQGTVNNDGWSFGPSGAWNVEAGQGRCKSIQPMTSITSASPYVRVEYQFEFRAPYATVMDSDGFWDSFKYRVANTGQRCFYQNPDDSTIAMAKIIFKGGNGIAPQEVTQDVRLDDDGTPLDSDSFEVNGIGTRTPYGDGFTFPTTVIIDTSTTDIVFLKYTLCDDNAFSGLSLTG